MHILTADDDRSTRTLRALARTFLRESHPSC
jgi:hypothetical protein